MDGPVNLAAGADTDMNVKCPGDRRVPSTSGAISNLKKMWAKRPSRVDAGDWSHTTSENNSSTAAVAVDGTKAVGEKAAAPIVPLVARQCSTVSVSIATFPEDFDNESRVRINTNFAYAIRGILTEAYGQPPCRADINNYAILRSGQGCSSCVCVINPPPGHPCTQFTALWIAARLIVWALASEGCSARAGLDGGFVETVFDAYDLPDVKGEAIESAARIMDCALPGQILANTETFVTPLEEPSNQHMRSSRLYYKVDYNRHDIVVGRGMSSIVQSIIGQVSSCTPYALGGGGVAPSNFGNLDPPEAKWYLSLNPSELSKDAETGVKVKVPPRELLKRHRRVAFVGITHDKLAKVFRQVLEEEPDHKWDRILILFLSDEKTEWAADSIVANAATNRKSVSQRHLKRVMQELNEDVTLQEADNILYGENNNEKYDKKADEIRKSQQDLIQSKTVARKDLEELLSGRVRELRFLEYDRPFYCASYWDWDEWGGFIHVSPMIWGADPKTCPAMNYHWIGMDPGDDYVAYQDGLSSLLSIATRF